MANFQFPCPACSQTIECDTQYAGMDLTCPVCQATITSPAAAAPATSPAPKKGRLSVTLPAPGGHQNVSGNQSSPQTTISQMPKKARDKGPIIKIAVAVVVIAVGLYFAWPYAVQLQKKFTKSVDESSAGSGGGQLGGTAELYAVLDATDPVNHETRLSDDESDSAPGQGTVSKPSENLPSIPPVYTLELEESDIPNSKVNGTVAGVDFIPDIIRFDRAGANYVLHLRQGTNAYPDRELYIYLRLKPGQTFETNTFEITKDLKTGAPQIVKKWKTGPRLFGQKNFSTGYMMKLEFEKIADGTLPGKIFIALPDPEKTVVAGHFVAETAFDSGLR